METWKKIPNYDGFMASSFGRIKTVKRLVDYGNRFCLRKERILKPHKSKVGYYTVAPFQKTTYVHQLIALAFIGQRPKNSVIDHKNGDYLDNRAENIRYVTQKENVDNAKTLGKLKTGENCSWSKLTVKQVLEIRQDKRPHLEIALQYKIARQSVSEIKTKKTWKHLI